MRRPSKVLVVVTSRGIASAMAGSLAAEEAIEPAPGRGVGGRFGDGDIAFIAASAARPRREVAIDRRVTEFGHQRHATAFGDELRHLRLRIAEVAEVARARGAHLHAGGLAFGFREVLVVDAVDAERALLHHAFDFAVLARAVRAGPRTQLAADAFVFIHQHDAVARALVARAGGAHGDARGRFAM